jgi:hypothetical protein
MCILQLYDKLSHNAERWAQKVKVPPNDRNWRYGQEGMLKKVKDNYF